MEDRLVPNAAIVSYTNGTSVTGVATPTTWMAQLPDSIPLTDVSAPGTYMSASGPSLENAFLGDGSSAAAAADFGYASLATAAASVIAAQVQAKLSAAANASATSTDTAAAAADADAVDEDTQAAAADASDGTADGAADISDGAAGTADGAAGTADSAAGAADATADLEAGVDSVADGAAGTADGLAATADDAGATADTAADEADGTAIAEEGSADSVNSTAAVTAEAGATADTAAATTNTAAAATDVTTFGSNSAASIANGLSAASNATGAVADELYIADTAENNSTGNNPNNIAMQATLVGLAQVSAAAKLAAAPADTATAVAYQAAAAADTTAIAADTTAAAADTAAATGDTTAAAADTTEDAADMTATSANAADVTADTAAASADEAAASADTAAATADATEVADTAAATSADAAAASANAAAASADAAATSADATAATLDASAASADAAATTADATATALDIAAGAEAGLDPIADAAAIAADATAASLDAAAGTADAAAVAADSAATTADAAATTAASTADGVATAADAAETAADGTAATADGIAAGADAAAVTADAAAVTANATAVTADAAAVTADTAAAADNAAAAATDATAVTDNTIAAADNVAATTADAAAAAAAAVSGPLDKLATASGLAYATAEKSVEAVELSVKTQDLSISDQLNDGIRSLDLPGSLVDDTININTKQYYTGLTLQDVLNDSTAYLQDHPSETIVLSLSSNDNPQGPEVNSVNSFNTDLNTLLNTADSSVPGQTYNKFIYYSSNPTQTPDLGEARGKIVIVPQSWTPTPDPTTGLILGWQPTEEVSDASGIIPTDIGTPSTLYINNLTPDSTSSSLGSSIVNWSAENYFVDFDVNRTTGIVGLEEPDQTLINEIIDENNTPIVVSSDSDASSAPGTLRDAIDFANSNPGVNTIQFARNLTGSTGQAILLQSNLPTITSDLDIVGSVYIDANGHTALQNSPTHSMVEMNGFWITTTYTVPVYFNTSGLTVFDHVAFITAAQTLTAGVDSGTMTLQLQAANDSPVIVSTGAPQLGASLMTNSTSPNAKFLNSTGDTITSVNFTAGSSTTSFLYYDEKRATPILTATVATVAVRQTETVNANVPNPASLVLLKQPFSVDANTPIMPVLEPLLDIYGNEVPNWTVTLSLNALSVAAKPPSRPLLSVTSGLTNTNGLASFPKASVNLPGAYTLRVSIVVNGKVYSITSNQFKISPNPLTVTTKVR